MSDRYEVVVRARKGYIERAYAELIQKKLIQFGFDNTVVEIREADE